MDDRDTPGSGRPGAPRRPIRHRSRPGGSARPLGAETSGPGPDAPAPASRASRPGEGGASGVRPLGGGDRSPVSSRSPGVRHVSASRAGADDRPAPAPTAVDMAPVAEDRPHGTRPGAERTPRRRAGMARPGAGRGSSSSPVGRRLSRIPRPMRLLAAALALLLIVTAAWGTGLVLWANSRIEHVDALSGAADTSGTTYLIAGSDRRGGENVNDGTEGARADTMMLLHRAPNGNSYLVSLPRDTLVDIPGHGKYKLNAAYSFGGPKLLVQTVEKFTGMTVDHFVEVGFDGVSGVVDAVGTVNLCIDQDVDDEKSGLKMSKGCHDTGGSQALAFVRARYFDPTADIGREKRQQQFVGALMHRVITPGVLLNPAAQVRLASAGTAALRTDDSTGVVTLARMGLAMRTAMNDGTALSMPIKDPNYKTKNSGVAILTDPQKISAFFGSIQDGSAKAQASG